MAEDRLRAVSDKVQREVERLLIGEARLLDERRFRAWLDLFLEEAHYWMPVRAVKAAKTAGGEFAGEMDLAFFDETKDSLRRRIEKLETGMAWAEEPPSRTRHLVTNIEAYEGESDSEVRVYCNFLVYRTRLETKEDLFVGRREELIRKENGSWRIAERKIFLDQSVLFADNLSIFF